MAYASVILDIATRLLDAPFSYAVPEVLSSSLWTSFRRGSTRTACFL